MNGMYAQQKRISGTKPELYQWTDRKSGPSQRPARPVKVKYEETKQSGVQVSGRVLLSVIGLMLVFVLAVWFGLLTRNAGIEKNILYVEDEIETLSQEKEALTLELNYESRADIVRQKGENTLGMKMPEETNVYVLKGIKINNTQNAQTAEASGRSR